MLRPAQLASLLIDTAGAIARIDFNNPANRRAYQSIERQITNNLTLQMKQFLVRNITKTPFDDERISVGGESTSLQELVGSLQNGGPVKQNSMDVLQMQMGQQVQAPLMEVQDDQAPRAMNGASEDTQPAKLREGDYVLNSLVKVTEGVPDLKAAIEKALGEARKDGLQIASAANPDQFTDKTNLVDVLLGDDEIVIPKELIPYLGLDKLEKMNNRGKELMKAVETAKQQQQQEQGQA